MLTADDLKNLTKIFSTRDEFITKVEFKQFKDQVLDTLDKVLGEIKGFRQDWIFRRA